MSNDIEVDVQEEVVNKDLTKWKNEPSVSDLKTDYRGASGDKDSQVTKIEGWLDLLNITGSAKPKVIQGKSSVQPKLVRKQAEWRYAALSEPFLNNEDIFAISPKTFKDREAATQNQMILNYQFNNQINKVGLVDKYVRAAVNEGTVIVRVCWDYEEKTIQTEVTKFEYVEATDVFSQQTIMQAQQLYMTNPEQFNNLPEAIQESVHASLENGRAIRAIAIGSELVEEVVVVRNQPDLTVCDFRNITVDPTCEGDFSKAGFLVYSFESSLSELKKAGIYKNLDKVEPETDDTFHDKLHDSSFNYNDKPRKKLNVYEYWGYWDKDGSGNTTPIVATWVNDVMIRLEDNPYPDGEIPFVVVPYLPVKNSIYGEPDAMLLEDNQKLIGALTRGMIDSMARSANGQEGIAKNALDAVNRRKYKAGQDYEFNPNITPAMAIIQHQYPELPASTYNMLNMFQLEAESITGVKSFAGGLSGDSLGTTARGVTGVLDAAGKRELGILRRLAAGMEDIARKILAMNAEWLSDEEVIRITDEEFVSINRDNLLGGFDIKLSISTAESDNIKAQELSFMLQTTSSVLPFDMTKIMLTEIAKLRNMPDLAKMVSKYEPQPDPKAEIELQLLQLDLQRKQIENQKLQQLTPAEVYKTMQQGRKYETEANKKELDFVEQESGVEQERRIEVIEAQAEGNTKRDIVNAALNATDK